MKRIVFIIVLLTLTVRSYSQELKLAPYTQYLVENPFVISPAYAGIDDVQRIRLTGVFQWVGMKNAPNTQTLSYDRRFSERSGAGFIFYSDKNGNTKQWGLQLSYAHHLTIDQSNDQYISFGLSYKFNHFNINTDNFIEDPYVNEHDPYTDVNKPISNHNFELSVLYRIERYYVSFNASNILNKNVDEFFRTEPWKLRNYYLFTGYTFVSKSEEFEYEPSVYFKYFESDKRSMTDINFKARKITQDGYIWVGFSTRFVNDQSFKPVSISPLIGLTKQNFYVGYGFQWDVNEASVLNNAGTHLLTLGYNFDNNGPRRY